jgi:hypothetical protein
MKLPNDLREFIALLNSHDVRYSYQPEASARIRLAIENLSEYSTLCDALLAFDSLLFLFAAFSSFISFRLQFRWRWRALLLAAEIALLCGLSFMVVVCGLLAWALT